MLSTSKCTVCYVTHRVLLPRFFGHYVVLERTGFFLHVVVVCVFFFLFPIPFSGELVVLKTVLYNR